MECVICLEKYDTHKRLPRRLSCGHTFCTSCIILVMKHSGPLRCAYCRSRHSGPVLCPADLSIHREMLGRIIEADQNDNTSQENDGSNSQQEPPQLSVLKLREAASNANDSGGKLWACIVGENDDGVGRYAQVTLINNRLHLHALHDGQPPTDDQTVPYERVYELVDEDAIIIFFEVCLGGNTQGRVYVLLLDNEGRTQQFKALCTGQRGPSYTGTRFLEVQRIHNCLQVWGGDYENNDGSGGAALSGMQRGTQNHQDIEAGLVAGYYFPGYGCDHNPSQFCIYVNNLPGYYEMSSIGRVIGGLEIITNVANLNDVREAYVSECGLLLSH
ncbi:hypothetical protein Pcinc_009476 [Petrolisthes cinctipes]|uniref:RING-type domain-containing protein n=1 Tax=Petrolisthes cinctipes TaxID=88211 RepID=A0AAE1KWF7_PETCI|nr:hypothetical protein Pcinc_009476 [Petrolisthes cinctipes]